MMKMKKRISVIHSFVDKIEFPHNYMAWLRRLVLLMGMAQGRGKMWWRVATVCGNGWSSTLIIEPNKNFVVPMFCVFESSHKDFHSEINLKQEVNGNLIDGIRAFGSFCYLYSISYVDSSECSLIHFLAENIFSGRRGSSPSYPIQPAEVLQRTHIRSIFYRFRIQNMRKYSATPCSKLSIREHYTLIQIPPPPSLIFIHTNAHFVAKHCNQLHHFTFLLLPSYFVVVQWHGSFSPGILFVHESAIELNCWVEMLFLPLWPNREERTRRWGNIWRSVSIPNNSIQRNNSGWRRNNII